MPSTEHQNSVGGGGSGATNFFSCFSKTLYLAVPCACIHSGHGRNTNNFSFNFFPFVVMVEIQTKVLSPIFLFSVKISATTVLHGDDEYRVV